MHRYWRSWMVAMIAAALGLGAYQYDNRIKDTAREGSRLKVILNDLEVLLMGPGMGVLGFVAMENWRLKDEAHHRRLLEERRQRFLVLGRLAASMAHEIRNPLQNLRLISEELRISDNARLPHWFDRLEVNLSRLDQVVMLAYELARPGPLPEDLDHLSLVPLVEASWQDICRQMGRTPSLIHLRPPAEAYVTGRRTGLGIAIENLLRNAIEATTSGEITIRYVPDASSWTLEIVNPGTIPQDVLSGEDMTTSLKPNGIGIGISIARHLARAVGGELIFQNTEQGVVTRLVLLRVPSEAMTILRDGGSSAPPGST